ncbi:hypothetical protein PCASD_24632, partial [Puccinia coronata f. sp. avenae]
VNVLLPAPQGRVVDNDSFRSDPPAGQDAPRNVHPRKYIGSNAAVKTYQGPHNVAQRQTNNSRVYSDNQPGFHDEVDGHLIIHASCTVETSLLTSRCICDPILFLGTESLSCGPGTTRHTRSNASSLGRPFRRRFLSASLDSAAAVA